MNYIYIDYRLLVVRADREAPHFPGRLYTYLSTFVNIVTLYRVTKKATKYEHCQWAKTSEPPCRSRWPPIFFFCGDAGFLIATWKIFTKSTLIKHCFFDWTMNFCFPLNFFRCWNLVAVKSKTKKKITFQIILFHRKIQIFY